MSLPPAPYLLCCCCCCCGCEWELLPAPLLPLLKERRWPGCCHGTPANPAGGGRGSERLLLKALEEGVAGAQPMRGAGAMDIEPR